MSEIPTPEFKSYKEEAEFWDNFDTGDYMEDDGEWVRIETDSKRAMRIAVLPEIVSELADRASLQGVALETIVNVILADAIRRPNAIESSLDIL